MSGTSSRVIGQSVSLGPKLRAALNNVLGGGAASVLTVTFGLSYALLIFAGPLAPYLSYGVAATFISSAVLATVIALGSSLPFAIGGPESSTAAVTGILASSLLERMAEAGTTAPQGAPVVIRSALGSSLPFAIGGPESSTAAVTGILASSLLERMAEAGTTAPQVAPVLITLGLSTIITGIVLCGFGVTRMGRAIRYVPYPVVGGFLGATGCLLVFGAIRVITGQRLQFATLDRFANLLTLSELAAACAMALVLYLTWHRSRSSFGLPAILIGGVVAAHIAFWLAGISLAEAQASGWTFQPPPHVSFMLPWSASVIRRYSWYT